MRKLSLKNLKLEAIDMLQKNQLKSIFGGYGGGYGGCNCHDYCDHIAQHDVRENCLIFCYEHPPSGC